MNPLTRPITWAYDVDPTTGATYTLQPTGRWVRTAPPRPVVMPTAINLPPPRMMRDPSRFAPIDSLGSIGFRRLVPPVPPPRRGLPTN